MIARIAFLVFALIVLGWLTWICWQLADFLNLAAQLVDRQHGPALAPEVHAEEKPQQPATAPELPAQKPSPQPKTEPMPKTDLVGGARISDQRITDPNEARIWADIEHKFRDWRQQLEETG